LEHSRRRRMLSPPLSSRLSMTRVSSARQNGQRTLQPQVRRQ
jgi:hypothetical protein